MAAQNMDLTEHKALKRRAADGAGPAADSGPTVHPLLRLQSQVGNSQVARMIAQRAEEDELQMSRDTSVQRAEEDELQMSRDTSVQRAEEDELQMSRDTSVQRAEEDELQMSRDDEQIGLEGGPVGADTESQIQSMRGSGSALDDTTRSSMESSFGTSFEDVRVHHNSTSDSLNRRLTSHAFTTGSDIFLRGDASPTDNHLLAHELTHVVQQRDMSGGSGTMSVGAAGDTHEQHAESVASSINSAPAAPIGASHDMAAQRAAEEDELQMSRDTSVQRAAEEDELQMSRDMNLQRAEEDEMAT